MNKDTAFSSFGRSDGFGASFPSHKDAGEGVAKETSPAFSIQLPRLLPFFKPTTGAASMDCHRKEQAQRGWGVSYEALREWQSILHTQQRYGYGT